MWLSFPARKTFYPIAIYISLGATENWAGKKSKWNGFVFRWVEMPWHAYFCVTQTHTHLHISLRFELSSSNQFSVHCFCFWWWCCCCRLPVNVRFSSFSSSFGASRWKCFVIEKQICGCATQRVIYHCMRRPARDGENSFFGCLIKNQNMSIQRATMAEPFYI